MDHGIGSWLHAKSVGPRTGTREWRSTNDLLRKREDDWPYYRCRCPDRSSSPRSCVSDRARVQRLMACLMRDYHNHLNYEYLQVSCLSLSASLRQSCQEMSERSNSKISVTGIHTIIFGLLHMANQMKNPRIL